METTRRFTVTDSMIDLFHHMNYKRYIDVFEEERANWFTSISLPFSEMRNRGYAVVILKVDFEYKKEARLGEHLTAVTCPGNMGNKSFTLKQTIYNATGKAITTSVCTFVMFDLKKRASIPVVEEIKTHFSVTTKAQ